MSELSIVRIKDYTVCRYPYLLIDQVTELIPGGCAKGYKNLTANEWFFPVHFPEEPMMPGMIQMEALLQMLSLTVLSLEGNEKRVVRCISANKISLKKRVAPGTRLDIIAELISFENGRAEGKAKGYINGGVACEGEFVFMLV